MKINWNSSENLTLFNPRLPKEDEARLRGILTAASDLKAHVFLLTSGTTARSGFGLKWVAQSKASILSAAESANRHLQSGSHDVWLHSLPDFHIGGVSIWARAALSGAKVLKSSCSEGWMPEKFVTEARESRATLCSLVPTQVHDLVRAGFHAPESLRAILLGGGAASPDLVTRARGLGWRVLPTYGMTETSSQIATSALESADEPDVGELLVLSHLEVASGTGSDVGPSAEPGVAQRLRVRGSSLFSGYVVAGSDGSGEFVDPKEEGWFLTEDLGSVTGRALQLLGRVGDRIKIGGETVHLGRLEAILQEEAIRARMEAPIVLLAVPDERLESRIQAIHEISSDLTQVWQVIQNYNRRVLPFERVRGIQSVSVIPRTELGKVKRGELQSLLASLEPSRSIG